MADLYTNIRFKRLEKGWSQQKLAEKMGYSDKSMIAKIENGKVDLNQSKIKAFADVLGCSPSELMGWTEIDIEFTSFKETNTNKALEMYYRYLAADKKTRKMIDMLLEDNEQ